MNVFIVLSRLNFFEFYENDSIKLCFKSEHSNCFGSLDKAIGHFSSTATHPMVKKYPKEFILFEANINNDDLIICLNAKLGNTDYFTKVLLSDVKIIDHIKYLPLT